MTKGQKYQKKINKGELVKLRKKNRTTKQIAAHFKCSIYTVDKAIRRYGLKHYSNRSIQKAAKTHYQTKIFSEANVHATTAQGMLNEVSKAVTNNTIITNLLEKIIDDLGKKKFKQEDIDRFHKAQDKMVQRMFDYRNLQKDFMGIVEMQKFIGAVVESYRVLPIEYRAKFQDELRKRNLIHLSMEQLVAGRDDRGGDGTVPTST